MKFSNVNTEGNTHENMAIWSYGCEIQPCHPEDRMFMFLEKADYNMDEILRLNSGFNPLRIVVLETLEAEEISK